MEKFVYNLASKNVHVFFKLLSLLLLLMMYSCSNDAEIEPIVDEQGLTRDIRELVPQNVLNEMEALGMPINGGATPPEIGGTYFISPLILLESNIATDRIGSRFIDYNITFSEQSQSELTVKVNYEGVNTSGAGTGSYIVGKGNEFSIFVEIDDETNGYPAKTVNVISGKVAADGIEDLHYAAFMVNDYGDPGNVFIEIGDGRIAYDSDGISEKN